MVAATVAVGQKLSFTIRQLRNFATVSVTDSNSAEGNLFRQSVGVSIPRSIRLSPEPIDFVCREVGVESATVG